MTLLAATPLADLEHDLRRAERSERRHFQRCPSIQKGTGMCDGCLAHMDRVINAGERLAAARSQVPDRHIFPTRAGLA